MYRGTLIVVRDMEVSRKFYCELFDMKTVNDFGANVELEGGLYLQTLDSWKSFIPGHEISFCHHSGELYFVVPDMEEFCEKLREYGAEYVHEMLEHRWGQRVVRFYDPDHHVIEAAEDIAAVVRRFYTGGMTEEEVAVRMDVPVEFVRECLKKQSEDGRMD